MNQEIAKFTLQFLQRVTLQPNEIVAFTAVQDALTEIAKVPTLVEALTETSEQGDQT